MHKLRSELEVNCEGELCGSSKCILWGSGKPLQEVLAIRGLSPPINLNHPPSATTLHCAVTLYSPPATCVVPLISRNTFAKFRFFIILYIKVTPNKSQPPASATILHSLMAPQLPVLSLISRNTFARNSFRFFQLYIPNYYQ